MNAFAIQTSGLKRHFGSFAAVRDLNLEVPEGAVYGFLGPNGAGKTTTIRMLLGLIKPTGGDVQLFGSSLRTNRSELLARIGSLVETPSLYSHLSGRENLEIFCWMLSLEPSAVDRVLSVVDLAADAHRLVKEYSLGMKQRLGLAVAMLANPGLLILDEPTNGLDPAGILEMRELLRRMPKEHGITVFLSSHLLNEVEQIASHIGIINKGVMLFQGKPADLQGQRHRHIMIEVDDPGRAEVVLKKEGWNVQKNSHRMLHIEASKPEDSAIVSAILVRNNLSLYHLSLEQSSLEDLFLDLTKS